MGYTLTIMNLVVLYSDIWDYDRGRNGNAVVCQPEWKYICKGIYTCNA